VAWPHQLLLLLLLLLPLLHVMLVAGPVLLLPVVVWASCL
jgi:hypothetical protein